MCTKITENAQRFRMNTRTVLWFLVFTGFAVNYMIRINLNIAIVSMVKPKLKTINTTSSNECYVLPNQTTVILPDGNSTIIEKIEPEGFDWNEYQQSVILGSFFWLHWTTQIPGGILANRYGTKLIFGLANFAGVLFCFIIPLAAYGSYNYLIIVRALQGIVSGFAWPAMHTMTARWIPPNERSKFVSAYLGSSVGAALTFPMCGYIIALWGWELVFYVSGILGTLWFLAWYMLVFDSPSEHPRITEFEKNYILNSLGASISKKKAPVPWRHLLTSVPVLMCAIAQFGGLWGLFTLITYGPTYIKIIHGLDIKQTGLLSGLPHILRMGFAYIFSLLGDHLLATNKISRTNVRKFATAVCTIGQGFCMLGLAYSGCNYTMAMLFLTAAIAVNGAVSTGPLASFVDLSPNYASILMGIGNGAAVFGGFVSPLVVGLLTYQSQTVAQWQKVFWVSTVLLFVSGGFYIIFSRSELEPWNNPELMNASDKQTEAEMVSLRKDEMDENEDQVNNSEKLPVVTKEKEIKVV